jgi:hypothetical protein
MAEKDRQDEQQMRGAVMVILFDDGMDKFGGPTPYTYLQLKSGALVFNCRPVPWFAGVPT